MADTRGLIRELADWDRQCFPLGGGDLMTLLVRFDFVPMAEMEAIYREYMREREDEHEWPPAYNVTALGIDGDAIPF